MKCYFLMLLIISVNFFRPPVCSNNVPMTRPSAPAFTKAFAVLVSLIPPPTIRNPLKTLLTVLTISGVMFCFAPDPASRYTNLMPRNCADSEYAAAIFGLSNGIPLTFPTNHAEVPSPMTKYAVGSAS